WSTGCAIVSEPGRTRRFRPGRPLDLRLTLSPLQRAGRWDPAVQVGRDEAWRATRNADGAVTAHYVLRGGEVEVEAWGPGAEVELDHAPDVLGEGDDPSGFRPSQPLLAELHRRLAGLRIIRTGAVMEALAPTIFEQKVIGAEARAGYGRMLRALGEPAPGPGSARLRVPP